MTNCRWGLPPPRPPLCQGAPAESSRAGSPCPQGAGRRGHPGGTGCQPVTRPDSGGSCPEWQPHRRNRPNRRIRRNRVRPSGPSDHSGESDFVDCVGSVDSVDNGGAARSPRRGDPASAAHCRWEAWPESGDRLLLQRGNRTDDYAVVRTAVCEIADSRKNHLERGRTLAIRVDLGDKFS